MLPEWLGQHVSLEYITIINCPKLTSLPKSLLNLTALRELRLKGCEGLETLPEWLRLLRTAKVTFPLDRLKNIIALRTAVGGITRQSVGILLRTENINKRGKTKKSSTCMSIPVIPEYAAILSEFEQAFALGRFENQQILVLNGLAIFPFDYLQASPSPAIQALVAPITKDTKTGLHTLSISNKNYLLDLSGQLLWSPCSPSHPTVPCSSGECAAASGAHKSCNNGGRACTARPTNPVTGERAVGDLTLADIVANATDGKTLTSEVTVRGVVSSCAPGSLLRSLPAMAAGDAGLGRGGVSLPTQLYSKLSLKRQFAVCLPSTAAAPGVAFFGGGPYNLMPPTLFDASAVLSYTDLARSPTNPSAYSIKLRGIAMNQEAVHLPPGALSRGGGVTLDTAAPYTVLRRDVYRPFVAAFAKATARIPRMPSVAPFELCFNSSALGFTRVGYAVAPIDLVTSGGRNWTVFGSNSLAQVASDTACLAFVDGGRAARSAVTVGAFQMENNFLLFDEAASRLGFSGTLFFIRTTCGNFNFARN
ncbi:hypothetical protein OsI_05112 [Oryza sativa Indica Group]|uniref:Peptidase A1 domain-containing protein n=1 Tax=Oryza sativa subsp. indica TaxID=39946 RepID=B8A8V3_ORYSI|nr:hypothetical protein OsI_05112 [Oryza sativa Indica Group]